MLGKLLKNDIPHGVTRQRYLEQITIELMLEMENNMKKYDFGHKFSVEGRTITATPILPGEKFYFKFEVVVEDINRVTIISKGEHLERTYPREKEGYMNGIVSTLKHYGVIPKRHRPLNFAI